MAGLIAAKSPAYRGMAPDARIVSVKVGVADGGTDVSQVIAAIDWVVQHRNDDDLDIRIINLSYGTNSAQDYRVDPLAYAAERAWKAGILVVAAGGNYGFQSHMNNAPALADPAVDPYSSPSARRTPWARSAARRQGPGLLAVAEARSDPWRRPGRARRAHPGPAGPELVHRRRPSRTAGSAADYFRGSGTSESAAIVSGAAALVLQKHPAASPDQVKKFLTTTASDIAARPRRSAAASCRSRPTLLGPVPSSDQCGPPRTGRDSLELARGTDHLTRDGVELSGEQDIFGQPFDSAAMAALEASARAAGRVALERQHLVRQQLVREHRGAAAPGRAAQWSGNSWSGSSWSGGQVVGQQLERQLLVRQQLVDCELGLAATRQVERGHVLALHSGHDARAVH